MIQRYAILSAGVQGHPVCLMRSSVLGFAQCDQREQSCAACWHPGCMIPACPMECQPGGVLAVLWAWQVWTGRFTWPSAGGAGSCASEASARVRRWRGSQSGAVWQKAMGKSLTSRCLTIARMTLSSRSGGAGLSSCCGIGSCGVTRRCGRGACTGAVDAAMCALSAASSGVL